MSYPQGLMSYPGIGQWLNATFTFGQGIYPSIGIIEVPAVNGWVPPQATGDLTFHYTGQSVTLRNCRITSAQFSRTQAGSVIMLQIADRRRLWQFGEISGRYNVRKADGESIEDGTEKTPQELARLCCEAMDERNPDVDSLPNEARPVTMWDVDNPAQALMRLCDQLGCRIVLGLDDRLRIVRNGAGRGLPGGPQLLGGGNGIAPIEPPSGIAVVCGPDRTQAPLKLEAVGIETNGDVLPIDQLSYRPRNGWSNEHPMAFYGVSNAPVATPDGSQVRPRDLALQSVWRWYRLKNEPRVGLQRKNMLLRTTLNETYTDFEGVDRERPAFAYGECWYPSLSTSNYKNQIAANMINARMSIDTARQVVIFGEPVAKLQGATFSEPEIYLLASYEEISAFTRQPRRTVRIKEIDERGRFFYRILRHDEIIRKDTHDVRGNFDSNVSEVADEANHYIEAALQEYQIPQSQTNPYPGILPIEPDGTIVQVTWSVGLGGATTVASRSTEHDRYVPSYEDQRRLIESSPQNAEDNKNIRRQVSEMIRGGR